MNINDSADFVASDLEALRRKLFLLLVSRVLRLRSSFETMFLCVFSSSEVSKQLVF